MSYYDRLIGVSGEADLPSANRFLFNCSDRRHADALTLSQYYIALIIIRICLHALQDPRVIFLCVNLKRIFMPPLNHLVHTMLVQLWLPE